MKSNLRIFGALSVLFVGATAFAAPAVDWAQPPVGCIEELAPEATADRDVKIKEIYDASERHGLPPQVLFGALMQEASFTNLGISADGGNFSCGIGQVNVREWCEWANQLDSRAKKAMEWPERSIPCDEANLPAGVTKPFYDIARTRAPSLSGEKRGSEFYTEIPYSAVKEKLFQVLMPIPTDGTASLPAIAITEDVVAARYQAASSFTRYCGDVRKNIRAKAKALAILFKEAVPIGLQKTETYPAGTGFKRKCMRSNGKVYPLHTGWLTAVAMYNAGKKFMPRLASYYRMTKADYENEAIWSGFNPKRLVEGIYGGGVYNPETNELNYFDLDGIPIEASWYKACVAQRHVARVVQYSTLPGKKFLSSLETGGCSQVVPADRQRISGFAEAP